MDLSAENLLVSLKGTFKEGEDEMQQIMESQANRRKINGGRVIRNRRARRVLMKNRNSRRGISKRVRTLKKLVPNTESKGMEGLFEETADYILSLQMRVRVMQIMVNLLSGSDDE